MRYFIALEIPDESRRELEAVQQQLKELFPPIRLTDNDKLHLTIAFVGEKPDELKEHLIGALKRATDSITSFEVAPAYIDGFPNLHHARTLWVGVKGDLDKLFVVRERVKDELAKLGLDVDERRYVPHIAIGKAANFYLPPGQEKNIEEMMSHHYFQPIQITSIKLFESIPEEGFHKHNTLAEIPLELSCEIAVEDRLD